MRVSTGTERSELGAKGARQIFAVSVHDPEAWAWVGDFIVQEETILFFNEADERAMFVCSGGPTVVRLLGECYRFEFYLTNQATEYVLCHNHHDYLIGVGTADVWLAARLRGERGDV